MKTDYVIVADGMVLVSYAHRSDAVLSARLLVKQRTAQGRTGGVQINRRDAETLRWIDPLPTPGTCAHGHSGDCMVCDPEPYEPARHPGSDGHVDYDAL